MHPSLDARLQARRLAHHGRADKCSIAESCRISAKLYLCFHCLASHQASSFGGEQYLHVGDCLAQGLQALLPSDVRTEIL